MKYELVNSSDEHIDNWTILDKEKDTTVALFWDKDVAEKCLEMLNNNKKTYYPDYEDGILRLSGNKIEYWSRFFHTWAALDELTEQQAKEQFPEAFK